MKQLLLTIVLTLFSVSIQAADITGIRSALKAGNASPLKSIIHDEADITLLKTTKKCNGTETVKLLNDFFGKNKPSDFKVLHQADKNDAGFFVGKLITPAKEYRVNITYRTEEGALVIQSIRIE